MSTVNAPYPLSASVAPPTRQEWIAQVEQLLLRRKAEIRRYLDSYPLLPIVSTEQRSAAFGAAPTSVAEAAIQQEIADQLAEVEGQELMRIDAVIERMRAGTYGICAGGSPSHLIALSRLQALPFAELCIRCQREAEKADPASRFRTAEDTNEKFPEERV